MESQPLALPFATRRNRPLSVCRVAVIVAVVELREIQGQMLLADLGECPNHTAF